MSHIRAFLFTALWFAVLPSVLRCETTFDVTSVKPHNPRDRNFSPPTCTEQRFVARTLPVTQLLTWAYDLRTDQFLALQDSMPSWAQTDAYDFEAFSKNGFSLAECKRLVQQLMIDRFGMKSHWKRSSNVAVYELTVAPKGQKLKLAAPTDQGCGVHILYQGQERPCDRYQFPLAPKRAMTMKELAQVLTIYKSRTPVVDKTGLSGEYKIQLSFTLRSDDPLYPSLETALRDQLGLVMRSTKGDSDALIVDSIWRPSGN